MQSKHLVAAFLMQLSMFSAVMVSAAEAMSRSSSSCVLWCAWRTASFHFEKVRGVWREEKEFKWASLREQFHNLGRVVEPRIVKNNGSSLNPSGVKHFKDLSEEAPALHSVPCLRQKLPNKDL